MRGGGGEWCSRPSWFLTPSNAGRSYRCKGHVVDVARDTNDVVAVFPLLKIQSESVFYFGRRQVAGKRHALWQISRSLTERLQLLVHRWV